MKSLHYIVILSALLFVTNGRSQSSKQLKKFSLKIGKLETLHGKRLVSFKIELKGARFESLRIIPLGWAINVDNASDGNSQIVGNIDVGAAAQDISFIEKAMIITPTIGGINEVNVNAELELASYRDTDKNSMITLKRSDVVFVEIK